MADIGVLPSKTSVSITSSNGENGTLMAATPQQAGVMTAEQAKQLDMVYRAVRDGAVAPIVIERPSAPVDAITRGELTQVLAEIQRVAATPLIHHDGNAASRLAALEVRVDELQSVEQRVVALAKVLDEVCRIIDGVRSDQNFLEKHAVAQVTVQEVRQ